MKNILITVVTLLLIVLIVLLMVKGLRIGKLEILSINQIISKNDELTNKISQANILNNQTYKKNLEDLKSATKKLSSSKEKYLDLASVSSDTEIKQANQEQSYSMEFLWSQIGNHATKEGVNLKLDITSTGNSNKNILNFTVTGSYMGIINFVKSLENDSDLNFRIEAFKLISGDSEINLNATFTVSNIGIKEESVSTTVNIDNTKTDSKENKTDNLKTNTNTTKDTNTINSADKTNSKNTQH